MKERMKGQTSSTRAESGSLEKTAQSRGVDGNQSDKSVTERTLKSKLNKR